MCLVSTASNTRHSRGLYFSRADSDLELGSDAIIKTKLISPVIIITLAGAAWPGHNINTQHNTKLVRALMNNVRSFCEDSSALAMNTIYSITMQWTLASLVVKLKTSKSYQSHVRDNVTGYEGSEEL